MKIRSGSTQISSPEVASPPRDIPDRPGERKRVVKRLKAIVLNHLEASTRIGYPLVLPDLLAVISALRTESEGTSPAAELDSGDEVVTHLREALFEELLSEPSNIFFTTQVSEETVRYEALPKDFWQECIDGLATELDKLKPRRS